MKGRKGLVITSEKFLWTFGLLMACLLLTLALMYFYGRHFPSAGEFTDNLLKNVVFLV